MRVLTVAAVLAAIGIGIAIPLLFGDEANHSLSRADVERQLREDMRRQAPLSEKRPESVRCRGGSEATYRCTVTYRGDSPAEADFFSYDIEVPASRPSRLERQIQLRLLSELTKP